MSRFEKILVGSPSEKVLRYAHCPVMVIRPNREDCCMRNQRNVEQTAGIAMVSDIHGNREALGALPDDYDELWVPGDLVNYSPWPAEVIELVRKRAALVVWGITMTR